ncbi:MAG: iron ABC transporter permease [Rhodospirillales bacterium]|nr:iron ABC transporter permease [Rhodospirillales bacterium]MBT4626562.1 iron ABC transporter permease [Rhodospirillales bacterium]MBT5352446.1 iron ABC transporter permease [Rhodospirillales bacterium]MBT5519343.1 iron ABC transporter permease [Rhodospirillales bacterium]MBT6109336.1 iron ABC transporter permease [Rhodospirillales bacterium]
MALVPSDDIWAHLASTVLPHYIWTTLVLMFGVGAGTLVVGTGTAWLVTMCAFPGRRIFEWALVLPLAVPAYVIAYVYTDVLEFAGPVQGLLRDMFGWHNRQDYWFPEIRSLGGAITMMTLVLYPYVYLLARAAFLEQSVCVLDVSRTLGKTPWQCFRLVALPLARPAVVAGVSLVMMETLNDFGTVNYFAVATFTAGIYDVWLNMNSISGAAQLASVMLMFVIALIALERTARKNKRYHHTGTKYSTLPTLRLSGPKQVLASVLCTAPILLGFVVPAWVLGRYSLQFYDITLQSNFIDYVLNSIGLATFSAILAVILGLFLAYAIRLQGSASLRMVARFASIGYAVPGAVLAIGVILPLTRFENSVDALSRDWLGIPLGLFISGTVGALVIGYIVRFLALSYGAVEASLAKVTPSMDGASRTLGHGPGRTLFKVHLPMMRTSILTAAILVFVDVMKELPMTMMLRPFNFETLATYVHQYASDELLEECALGALSIVIAGILPVIILSRAIARSRPGQK